MHRRKPRDRNAGSAQPACTYQTPCFFEPIGVDIGLQQCELDQIVLRSATANAFIFPCERGERLDRAEKSPCSNAAKPRAAAGR